MTWLTPYLDSGSSEHQWRDEDGYWCAVCGRYLESADGVVIHDDVPHPLNLTFDEDDRKPH